LDLPVLFFPTKMLTSSLSSSFASLMLLKLCIRIEPIFTENQEQALDLSAEYGRISYPNLTRKLMGSSLDVCSSCGAIIPAEFGL